MIPPYSLDLRLVWFLNLFQSLYEIAENDLSCVANDIDGGRKKATNDEKFFPVFALDASEGQFVVFQADFEPHLALFVHDEDPLLFYRVITREAQEALNKGGLLAFEINERYGQQVVSLLKENGFSDVQLVVDTSGKPRIVKGIKD